MKLSALLIALLMLTAVTAQFEDFTNKLEDKQENNTLDFTDGLADNTQTDEISSFTDNLADKKLNEVFTKELSKPKQKTWLDGPRKAADIVRRKANWMLNEAPEKKILDSKGKNASAEIDYFINDATIKFTKGPVKEIFLDELNSPTELPRVEEVPKNRTLPVKRGEWTQIYAIDPTQTDFISGTVTVNATGRELYKCKEWNFNNQTCNGTWKLFLDNLTPGELYTFTIDQADPAFGEINATGADHLDSNYNFIEDIFGAVNTTDNVWSKPIPAGDYVRVTFEHNLENGNVIDFIARDNGTVSYVEIYIANTTTLVGRGGIADLGEPQHIEMTNLPSPTDKFDFKIVKHYHNISEQLPCSTENPDCADGSIADNAKAGFIEFDYIHDQEITNLGADGIVAYSESAVSGARFRNYNQTNQSVGNERTTTVSPGAQDDFIQIVSNHERDETIMVEQDESANVTAQIWNGTAWGNIKNLSSNIANTAQRGFDVAIEQISGDVLVVYENSTANDSILGFNIWNGTAWSGQFTYNRTKAATANWVKAVPRPNSDEIMVLTHDADNDLVATLWTGENFSATNQVLTISVNVLAGRVVDFQWESISGDGVAFYSNSTTIIAKREFNSTTKAWHTDTILFTLNGGVITNLVTCPDPTSDRIGLMTMDSTADVNARIWNGVNTETSPAAPAEQAVGEATTQPATNIGCAFTANNGTGIFGLVIDLATAERNVLLCTYNRAAWSGGLTQCGNTAARNISLSLVDNSSIENLIFIDSHPAETNEVAILGANINEDLHFALWNGTHLRNASNATLETTTDCLNGQGDCYGFDWIRYDREPNATIMFPSNGTTFNTSQTVNITLNTTDNLLLGIVNVTVIKPDGTSSMFNMTRYSGTNISGLYHLVYNDTSTTGQYNFSIRSFDNSTHNNSRLVTGTFTISAGAALACGDTITTNTTLTTNLNCAGTGLIIGANNVGLNCNGFNITYDTAGNGNVQGVNVTSMNNVTIQNCIIKDGHVAGANGIGIRFASVTNSTVLNTTIRTNGTTNNYGILLSSGSRHYIRNNTIYTNGTTGSHGIHLDTTSLHNIYQNFIRTNGSSTSYGISFTTTNQNRIENNTLTTNGTSSDNVGIGMSDSEINIIIGNTIFAGGNTASDGISISDVTSRHNNITNNNITTYTNISHGIEFASSANNNTVTNALIRTFGNNSYGVRSSANVNYIINTTLNQSLGWIQTTSTASINATNTTFITTNGNINFRGTVNISGTQDVNASRLNITSNAAFVNTTNLTMFNTTAFVTLSGLGFTDAEPTVDFEDDTIFDPCAPVSCTEQSYSGGILVFNVSRWTTYSSREFSYCGNTITTSTTLTQNYTCTGKGIEIGASDVTLNCNGFTIRYDTAGLGKTYGVGALSRSSPKVLNCILIDGSLNGNETRGMTFNNSNHTTVHNSSINVTSQFDAYGIEINSQNNVAQNASITNTTINVSTTAQNAYAIRIGGSAHNFTIKDNHLRAEANFSAEVINILATNAQRVFIQNNTILANNTGTIATSVYGININTISNSTISNNTITTNSIVPGTLQIISIAAPATNITIDRNYLILRQIEGTGQSFTIAGHSHIIQNNIFNHTSVQGQTNTLDIAGYNITLRNNSVYSRFNQTGGGVGLITGQNNTIVSNLIVAYGNNSDNYGMSIGFGGRGNHIANNTIYSLGTINNSAIRMEGVNFAGLVSQDNYITGGMLFTNGTDSYGIEMALANNTIHNVTLNGTTAWISSVNNMRANFSNITFATPNGSIRFYNTFNMTNYSQITQTRLNITNNSAFINTSNLTFLNTTSQINFHNVIFADPTPIVDFLDTGTFSDCSPTVCTEQSYSAGTYIFNVTRWTTYKTEEFTYCGKTITTDTNITADYNCTGSFVTFGTSSIYLDCNGHTIIWDTGGTGVDAIIANSLASHVIRNCRLIDGSAAAGGTAISTLGSSQGRIYNNTITTNGTSTFGITINQGDTNLLENNTIDYSVGSSTGIKLFGDTFQNRINNNNITINGTHVSVSGIWVEEAVENVISNNFIRGNATGLLVLGTVTQDNNFTSNNITQYAGTGINTSGRSAGSLYINNNVTLLPGTSKALYVNRIEPNQFRDTLFNFTYGTGADWMEQTFSTTITTNLINTTFANPNGSIKIKDNISIVGFYTINISDLNITNSTAYINSTRISTLNTSSQIILRGLTLTDPEITVDFEDDNTFTDCSPSICTEDSYTGGVSIFNVTRWTAYRAQEFSYCGDTLTSNTTLAQNQNCQAQFVTIGAANMTLDCNGYIVTYDISGVGAIGINASNQNNLTVKNCILIDGNSAGSGGGSINFTTVTNSTILNNTLRANGTAALRTITLNANSHNNTVENNTVRVLAQNAIGIELATPASFNKILRNNIGVNVTNGGSQGVSFTSGNETTIANNTIRIDNAGGITGTTGILPTSVNLSVIRNNTILVNGMIGSERGIFITTSNANVIDHNNLTVNGTTLAEGIRITGSANNTLHNNIITANATGNNAVGINMQTDAQLNNVSNNTIRTFGVNENFGIGILNSYSVIVENNTVITNGTAGVNYGIRVANINGQNNTIRRNYVETHGTRDNDGFVVVLGASRNTFTNNTINAEGNFSLGFNISAAANNTFNNTIISATEWIFTGSANTNNTFTNITFQTANGSIKTIPEFQLNGTFNISQKFLNITNNTAFLNSTNLSALNLTSQIILRGITFTNPQSIVDFEDDGTFADCPGSTCTEISYTGGVFTFNVSRWTTYSSQEAPACPGTITTSYTINTSLTTNTSCITMGADNTTLDCNGNTIFWDLTGTGADAIAATNRINVTIKNCILRDANQSGASGIGINFLNVNRSFILNNTIQTNGTTDSEGVFFTDSNHNVIFNNTIRARGIGAGTGAIDIGGTSTRTAINNNTLSTEGGGGTARGIYMYGGPNDHSNITNNYIQTSRTGGGAQNIGIDLNLLTGSGSFVLVRSNYINTNGTNNNDGIITTDDARIDNNTIVTGGTGSGNVGIDAPFTTNLIVNNKITTSGTTGNIGIDVSAAAAVRSNITNNTITTEGSSGSDGIMLRAQNTLLRNNITIIGNSSAISISGAGGNNTFNNTNITIIQSGAIAAIDIASTNNGFQHTIFNASTNWIQLSSGSAAINFTNSTFLTPNGSIRFPGQLNLTASQNISQLRLNITNNNAFVNTSALTNFNTSAQITLEAITFTDPEPYVDFLDTGTFSPCSPSICTEISYTGGIYTLNVSRWTSYKAQEALACGDTMSSSTSLNKNYTCNATFVTFGADNIALDCSGYTIFWDSTGGGHDAVVANSRTGLNITNCIFRDSNASGVGGIGINFSNVNNSDITNVTIQTNGTTTNDGILLANNSHNNTIQNSTIFARGSSSPSSTTTNDAIELNTFASSNLIRNNNLDSFSGGLNIITNSTHNNILNNRLDTGGTIGVGTLNAVYFENSANNMFNNNTANITTATNHRVILITTGVSENSNNITISNNSINSTHSAAQKTAIYESVLGGTQEDIKIIGNNINVNGTSGGSNDGIRGDASCGIKNIAHNIIRVNGTSSAVGIVTPCLAVHVNNNTITVYSPTTTHSGISLSNTGGSNIIANNTVFVNGTTTNDVISFAGSNNIVENNNLTLNATGTSNAVQFSTSSNNNLTRNNITMLGTGENFALNLNLNDDNNRINHTIIYNGEWIRQAAASTGNIYQNTTFATGNGSITIINATTLSSLQHVNTSGINISFNQAHLNSTNLTQFNTTAQIILKSLAFTDPQPTVDYEEDGTYETCPGVCTEISYTGGTFIFNVTHFTNFSSQESPACPGTITSNHTINESLTTNTSCVTFGADNIVLDCQGNTIFWDATGTGADAIIANVRTNITIKNCILQDINSSGFQGIGINWADVTNSRAYNNTINTQGTTDNYGIQFTSDCINNDIYNNTVRTTGTGASNLGIALNTGTTAVRNRIENNSILTNGTGGNTGVTINNARHNNVTGNTIIVNGTGANNPGVGLAATQNNTVANNYIRTNGTNTNEGISTSGDTTARILNNTIYSEGTTTNNRGIDLSSASSNLVANNTIRTNGTTGNIGIYLFVANNNIVENNAIITNGTGNNYGILVESSATNNFTRHNITTIGTSSHGIFSINTATNNQFNHSNINATGTTVSGYATSSTATGTLENTIFNFTTQWIDTTGASDNNTFINTTFETPNGSIRIYNNFTLIGVQSVTRTKLNVSLNNATLNSTNLSALNTTAQITLNGLSFTDAQAIVDFENDGTFIICDSSICTEQSYTGGTYVFNVTRFTEYRAQEAVAVCPGTITTNTNITGNITTTLTNQQSCVNFGANNIVLECNGNTITSNQSGLGINASSRTGITVQNCIIKNFNNNIQWIGTSTSRIHNTTVINATNNNIYFDTSANTNNLTYITAQANSTTHSILLQSSDNIRVYNLTTTMTSTSGSNALYFFGTTNSILENYTGITIDPDNTHIRITSTATNNNVTNAYAENGTLAVLTANALINTFRHIRAVNSTMTSTDQTNTFENLTINTTGATTALSLGTSNNFTNINATSLGGIAVSGLGSNARLVNATLNSTASSEALRIEGSLNQLRNITAVSTSGIAINFVNGGADGNNLSIFNATTISGTSALQASTAADDNYIFNGTATATGATSDALSLSGVTNTRIENITLQTRDAWIVTASSVINNTLYNVTFVNANGSINISNSTLVASITYGQNILNITSNQAFINSTNRPELNTTSQITLLNIPVTNPGPTVDFEDDGTVTTCPGSICTVINPSNTTFIFNVTRWTAYSSEQVLTCGDTITTNTTLTQNFVCNTTFLTLGANNIVLDCAGKNITYNTDGSDNSTAIWANQKTNITIKNCGLFDGNNSGAAAKGINFTSVNMSTIQNVSITANGTGNNHGIVLQTASHNNTIKDSLIKTTGTANNNWGILILQSSRNNITDTLINTTGTGSNYGIHPLTESHNNTIARNTIYTDGTTNNNGLRVTTSSQNHIINNSITTNGTTGNIVLVIQSTSDDTNITGNNLTSNGTGATTRGIGLSISIRTNITNNRIITKGTTGGDGIDASSSITGTTINNNTIDVQSTSTGGNGILLRTTTTNNYITNNYIIRRGTGSGDGIRLTTSAHNNTFQNNFINTLNTTTTYGITIESSGDNTFNGTILNFTGGWIDQAEAVKNNFSNTTFLTPNGSINLTPAFELNGTQNITQHKLNITLNQAFINSTNLTALNTTAQITLLNIPVTNPGPTVDFEDDGTYTTCSSSICTVINPSNTTFIFNVTRWTAYSTEQTLACGDTIIANTTLTQNYTCNTTFVTFGANDIALDCNGNTISYDSTGTGADAIQIFDANNVIVRNCILKDINGSGANGAGVNISNANNTILFNNTIIANGTTANYGIRIRETAAAKSPTNITIAGNSINTSSPGGYGIYTRFTINTTIANNTISVNGSSSGTGILTEFTNSNVTLHNNTIYALATTISTAISISSTNATITNNTLIANGSSASNSATLSGSTHLFQNNTLITLTTQFADGTALGLSGLTSSRIENNTITSLAGASMDIAGGSDNNLVTRNYLYSNGTGIGIRGGSNNNNFTLNNLTQLSGTGIGPDGGGALNQFTNNNITLLLASGSYAISAGNSPQTNFTNTYINRTQVSYNWARGTVGTSFVNFTNTTFATQNGSIRYYNNFNITGTFDLTEADLNITLNKAFVNSTSDVDFNQTSQITLLNIPVTNPGPTVDFEDDGTFATCSPSICTVINPSNTTFIFNVTRWTAYSTEQTVACGDTITTSTTISQNYNCTANFLTLGANNITLNCNGNTVFWDAAGTGSDAIIANARTGLNINNCIFRDSNASGAGGIGINFSNTNNSIITNVTIQTNGTNGSDGISLGNLSYNNTIQNSTIFTLGSTLIPISGVTNDALDINLSSNNFIIGNRLDAYSGGTLITQNSSYNTFRNNHISSGGTAEQNGVFGFIYIQNSPEVYFINNTINGTVNSSPVGILVHTSTGNIGGNLSIFNNTINISAPIGVTARGYFEPIVSGTQANTHIIGNEVNVYPVLFSGGSTQGISLQSGTCSAKTIAHNRIRVNATSTAQGINVVCPNVHVYNNTITVYSSASNSIGITIAATTPLIANNTIFLNGTTLNSGIALGISGTNHILTDNNITINTTDSTSIGLDVNGVDSSNFTRNNITILGMNTVAIDLTNNVDNNLFNHTLINISMDASWADLNILSIGNIFQNTTFATPNGSIQIAGNFSMPVSTQRINTTLLNISNNKAFINSTNLSELNRTSQIILKNITFAEPQITVDFEDDGTYTECSASICTPVSFTPGTYIFNVTRWTAYSIRETPQCPGTITSNHTINESLTTNTSCVTFGADNIVLDCTGKNITYNVDGSDNSTAIWANQKTNITIKNCGLFDGNNSGAAAKGINFTSVNMSTIQNVSITANGTGNNHGIVLQTASHNNTIKDSLIKTTGTANNNWGILILQSSRNNVTDTLINTTGSGNNYGIHPLTNSHNNTITRNTIYTDGTSGNNHGILVTTSSTNQIINNSITTNGTVGSKAIQTSTTVVDTNITGNNLTTNATSAGNVGGILLSSTVVRANITNNYIITKGTDLGIGIAASSFVTGTTIYNNTMDIQGTSTGGTGISLAATSTNNYIINNYIIRRGTGSGHGIRLTISAHNNTFQNNFINTLNSTTTYGITIESSGDNTFNGTILNFTGGWIDQAEAVKNNFSNTTFLTPNGSINLTPAFELNGTQNITQHKLNITLNQAFINSTNLTALNTTAQIILAGLTTANLQTIYDIHDDNLFDPCPGVVCTFVSYTGGRYIFNVTRWTAYRTIFAGVNFTINKTDNPDPLNVSNLTVLNYTIIVNVTDGVLHNATLNETYPLNTSFINASPAPTTGNNFWNIGNITAQNNFTILIQLNVSELIANGTVINNTVNMTYQNSSSATNTTNATANTTIINAGAADLTQIFLNASTFNPSELQNISLNATILNNGSAAANNFAAEFRAGNCTSGLLITNFTGITLASLANITLNTTWIAQPPGPVNISICADTTNIIEESNEFNNNLSMRLNVKAYADYYGNLTGNITLDTASNNTEYDWNFTQSGNVYFTDSDQTINFSRLIPLGKNTTGGNSTTDFLDLDANLNMTTFNDSIQTLWAQNSSAGKQFRDFTVRGRLIQNVSVINATGNFYTGILWDSTTDTNGQYDTTDREPIVFIANINRTKAGQFGTYDYEAHVPVLMRTYNSTSSLLAFYIELR